MLTNNASFILGTMEQYEGQEKLRQQNLKESLKNGIRDSVFKKKKFYNPYEDARATANTWWMAMLLKSRPLSEPDSEKSKAVQYFRDHFKTELSQLRNNRQTSCKQRFSTGKYRRKTKETAGGNQFLWLTTVNVSTQFFQNRQKWALA
jgi:hypothetical protein